MRRQHFIRLFALAVVLVPTLAAASADAAQPKAPVNTALPTVSGTPTVGATLGATSGSWSGEKMTFTYQWLKCDGAGAACSRLANEVAPTHVVAASETGSTLRVTVTAKSANSRVDANSAP